jgi:hypothetical protein
MIRVAAIAGLLLSLSADAAAQTRAVEVFAGYTFVHDAKNDVSLPAGWLAGGAVQLAGWLSAVADASGSYNTEQLFGADIQMRAHGVLGGGRASAPLGPLTEFAQLLVGIVRGSGTAFGFTDTANAFAVQPGVGLDYPLTDRLAARGQLDVRFIHNQPGGNQAGYEYRISAALVYRIR